MGVTWNVSTRQWRSDFHCLIRHQSVTPSKSAPFPISFSGLACSKVELYLSQPHWCIEPKTLTSIFTPHTSNAHILPLPADSVQNCESSSAQILYLRAGHHASCCLLNPSLLLEIATNIHGSGHTLVDVDAGPLHSLLVQPAIKRAEYQVFDRPFPKVL